jgi:putative transcriptional regulator
MENQLAKIREQKNITQEELAVAAGVTRAHISKIENGKYMGSIKVLSRIAQVLDVQIEDIFFNLRGN